MKITLTPKDRIKGSNKYGVFFHNTILINIAMIRAMIKIWSELVIKFINLLANVLQMHNNDRYLKYISTCL